LVYVRFPLSLRNVEDLLFGRGIDICHETVRLWWNRFGPLFAGDIRRQRLGRMRGSATGQAVGDRQRTLAADGAALVE
jgi:putative transposase